jgi:hypothetical protein
MRDWTEQLKELRARFDEQNAELDQVWNTLGSLGDSVELSVPQAVLDEIDDGCAVRSAEDNAVRVGIRA